MAAKDDRQVWKEGKVSISNIWCHEELGKPAAQTPDPSSTSRTPSRRSRKTLHLYPPLALLRILLRILPRMQRVRPLLSVPARTVLPMLILLLLLRLLHLHLHLLLLRVEVLLEAPAAVPRPQQDAAVAALLLDVLRAGDAVGDAAEADDEAEGGGPGAARGVGSAAADPNAKGRGGGLRTGWCCR